MNWLYTCLYLHLYVIVWELFTDFPQVSHHSSLLHSSVHLEHDAYEDDDDDEDDGDDEDDDDVHDDHDEW